MTGEFQHHLNQPYHIHVAPDRGTRGERLYFATVVELPGCESHGATAEEAMRNVRDAMALYIESMLEDGLVPPPPHGGKMDTAWPAGTSSQRSQAS